MILTEYLKYAQKEDHRKFASAFLKR